MSNPNGDNPDCTCICHDANGVIYCCRCYANDCADCNCGNSSRCCGDPGRPNRPDYPKAPGWEPGDTPGTNPLDGATDPTDRKHRFDRAVIDILREGGMPKGPKFGPRKDEFLPYLLIRAAAGDRGNRPYTGAFWESPDIFVAPDLAADAAPDTPTTLGGVAHAGAPNTLWAHVWNLGRSPVYNARVEFYWFNPSLGFNRDSANLIGVTYVDLGSRESGNAHRVVKCPVTWVPTFVNGGHECLVVRVFEPLTDPVALSEFNAGNDRHVGQRNIAVVNASSPAALELHIRLGCGAPQGNAQLLVQRVPVDGFGWMAVLADNRDHGYTEATLTTDVAGFTYPTPVRADAATDTFSEIPLDSVSRLISRDLAIVRGCDELEILFFLHADGIASRQAAVYRIMQTMDGVITGGYTVIARRP
ncbi:MAG TPA: hypothetical protein VHI13_10435 [Candidatus Kapabacteria bacterium]|nr:hypothetical protein [Candidatus Kapabacteria bacterium]